MSENVGGAFYAYVDGKGALVKAFDVLGADVIAGVKQVVERNAQAIVRSAQQRVPVKTGELRNTIRYEITTDTPTAVIANVMAGYGKITRRGGRLRNRPGRGPALKSDTQPGIYAPVVEFGSKSGNVRQARPFLFPAARIQRSSYIADLTQMLNGAAKKAEAA